MTTKSPKVLKTKDAGSAYSVPAVHRMLDVIETLAVQRAMTVSDISRQFKIPKSSVYAILQTLKSRGYLEKDAEDRYSLTLRLFSLGASLVEGLDLRSESHPLLEELCRSAGITGHIAIRDGGYAVYIDKVEVLTALRLTTWVGRHMHLHSTSMGKALLSGLSEGEIDQLVAEHGLPALTPRTITDPKLLKEELARVRAQGYSISNEENEIGVRAVAAPIFNGSKRVIAAVNLGASKLQINVKDFHALGTLIRSYALRISTQLGYRSNGIVPGDDLV